MLKPTIQPEEILIGYLSRAASWNSANTRSGSLYLQTRRAYEQWGRSSCENPIRLAADLSGFSVDQLCRKHSLMPLFIPNSLDPEFWGEHRLWLATRLLRYPLHFCPDCVIEDLDYHGFSYWRRDHQLMGAFWCLKHGSQLIPAKGAFNSYWCAPPSHYLHLDRPIIPDGIPQTVGQSRIKTFLDLQSQILSSRIEVPLTKIISVCEQRARSLGFRLHMRQTGMLFVDLLTDQFPEAWLRIVYPNYSHLPSGDMVRKITISPKCTVFPRIDKFEKNILLVTIAALWESADEALYQLQAGSPREVGLRSISDRKYEGKAPSRAGI